MIYALLEPCTSPKPFVHLVSDPFILAYTIGIFATVLFQIINIKNEINYFHQIKAIVAMFKGYIFL